MFGSMEKVWVTIRKMEKQADEVISHYQMST